MRYLYAPTRKYTNILLEMVDTGILSHGDALLACLSAMSEDDVRDMMEANDLLLEPAEEDEEWEQDDEQALRRRQADYEDGSDGR